MIKVNTWSGGDHFQIDGRLHCLTRVYTPALPAAEDKFPSVSRLRSWKQRLEIHKRENRPVTQGRGWVDRDYPRYSPEKHLNANHTCLGCPSPYHSTVPRTSISISLLAVSLLPSNIPTSFLSSFSLCTQRNVKPGIFFSFLFSCSLIPKREKKIGASRIHTSLHLERNRSLLFNVSIYSLLFSNSRPVPQSLPTVPRSSTISEFLPHPRESRPWYDFRQNRLSEEGFCLTRFRET